MKFFIFVFWITLFIICKIYYILLHSAWKILKFLSLYSLYILLLFFLKTYYFQKKPIWYIKYFIHNLIFFIKFKYIFFFIYSSRSFSTKTIWKSCGCMEYRSHFLYFIMWLSAILWWKWCEPVCTNFKR